MKKLRFFNSALFLTLIIISFTIVLGCEKDPLEYTADVAVLGEGGSVNPSGKMAVSPGSTTLYTFVENPGYKLKEIYVNYEKVPQDQIVNNSYSVSNVTGSYKLEVVFEDERIYYLKRGEWIRDSLSYLRIDGVSWEHILTRGVPGETQMTLTFFEGGKTIENWNGKFSGDSPWTVDKTKNPPVIRRGAYIVEEVTENRLVLADHEGFWADYPDAPFCVKFIYSHAKNGE